MLGIKNIIEKSKSFNFNKVFVKSFSVFGRKPWKINLSSKPEMLIDAVIEDAPGIG